MAPTADGAPASDRSPACEDPAVTAFLIQNPTPGCDFNAAMEAMDPAKDADGLHPVNLGRLVLGVNAPLPCTPRGIVELLRRYEVPLAGARVCVIGRGITVGRPIGLLLTRRSENATGARDLLRVRGAARRRRNSEVDQLHLALQQPSPVVADDG